MSSPAAAVPGNPVFIRWTANPERVAALLASKGITLSTNRPLNGHAVFNTPEEADKAIAELNRVTLGDIDFVAVKATNAPREEEFASATTIKLTPDVSTVQPDASKLVTVHGLHLPSGAGAFSSRATEETAGTHIQTVAFKSQLGTSLSSLVQAGNHQFKVISINVRSDANRLSLRVFIYDPVTKRTATTSFVKSTSESGDDVRVRAAAFPTGPTADGLIPVNYIVLDKLTYDPATGAWSELQLSINSANVRPSALRDGNPPRPRGGAPAGGSGRAREGRARGSGRAAGAGPRGGRGGPRRRGERKGNTTTSSTSE